MPVLLVALLSQFLFTSSDLMGRYFMKQHGFTAANFISWWFLAYMAIRMIATVGQLYIFSTTEVGKTMAYFGAFSLILVNIAGVLFLQEVLPTQAYIGVALVVAAIVLIALSK